MTLCTPVLVSSALVYCASAFGLLMSSASVATALGLLWGVYSIAACLGVTTTSRRGASADCLTLRQSGVVASIVAILSLAFHCTFLVMDIHKFNSASDDEQLFLGSTYAMALVDDRDSVVLTLIVLCSLLWAVWDLGLETRFHPDVVLGPSPWDLQPLEVLVVFGGCLQFVASIMALLHWGAWVHGVLGLVSAVRVLAWSRSRAYSHSDGVSCAPVWESTIVIWSGLAAVTSLVWLGISRGCQFGLTHEPPDDEGSIHSHYFPFCLPFLEVTYYLQRHNIQVKAGHILGFSLDVADYSTTVMLLASATLCVIVKALQSYSKSSSMNGRAMDSYGAYSPLASSTPQRPPRVPSIAEKMSSPMGSPSQPVAMPSVPNTPDRGAAGSHVGSFAGSRTTGFVSL